MTTSTNPVPTKKFWHKNEGGLGDIKEVEGCISILHWHCKTPMKRVIRFQRLPNRKVIRIGLTSWVCQVCEKRKYRNFE